MAGSELEKAFSTLTDAFAITEKEIEEEVKLIQQQIEQLKERILSLNTKQKTISSDRDSLAEMYQRYNAAEGKAVEF